MNFNEGGVGQIPRIDDWADWVSASAMRNFVMGDPLLDWLDRYGDQKGFIRDPVDERTDFGLFVMRKGLEFERAVMDHLVGLDVGEIRWVIAEDASREERFSDDAVVATLDAMRLRVPLVAQGSLRHAESRTYGFPDLLVRSDVLTELFPGALSESAAAVPAPGLGLEDCHYVVVDVKFTTLGLLAGGDLGNSGSSAAYKVQLFVYNRALGEVQGFVPPHAFLLGRGWEQTVKKVKSRGRSCMDRLAPVAHHARTPRAPLTHLADAAAEWVRRLRSEGDGWEALPEASLPELRPNAQGEPGSWKSAVRRIVDETEDLTVLWQVGVAGRDKAAAEGLSRWTDPALTPASVGVGGPKREPTLQLLLDVNRGVKPSVHPDRINAERGEWIEPADVEFFVDFETVSDLDDDFSAMPQRGGQALIFMVGCGHLEDGEWRFRCFTAEDLTVNSEAEVIDDWLAHMAEVTERLARGSASRVFHWSAHESSSLETAYNSAAQRHPEAARGWPEIGWFDFLSRVVRSEPVVVRGAHAFGLKAVANALHDLGRIDVSWDTGPTDGLGAMVGAWWCQHELDAGRAKRLVDVELMSEIEAYNEVDCRAMMAIIGCLRSDH